MRNIWGWIIAVLIAVGIGATVMKFIGDKPSRTVQAPSPPPPAAETTAKPGEKAEKANGPATGAAATAAAPKPDGTFSDVKVSPEDYTLGKPDAPVTLVEYASFTCPHCAEFHSKVLPAIKTEFIDTGKVRLVFRDYPLDRVALAASMLARCAGRDRYFGFVDAFFAAQANWARDPNPVAALGRIARVGGIGEAEIDACLKNSATEDAVLKQRIEGEKTFNIRATPTLIIGGDKYSGGVTIEQFRAIVAKKLEKS